MRSSSSFSSLNVPARLLQVLNMRRSSACNHDDRKLLPQRHQVISTVPTQTSILAPGPAPGLLHVVIVVFSLASRVSWLARKSIAYRRPPPPDPVMPVQPSLKHYSVGRPSWRDSKALRVPSKSSMAASPVEVPARLASGRTKATCTVQYRSNDAAGA